MSGAMATFSVFPHSLINFNIWRYTCEPKVHSLKRKLMSPLLAMDVNSSRHLANFHSNIWGYHFLSYTSQLTVCTQKYIY